MRTMYDSVTAANIPDDAEIVAGYVDGRYRWSDADWARFPDAVKVRIACFASTDDGHVLDVETGDATPEQAPGWIRARQVAGLARPTIYCNTSTIDAVRQACATAEVDNWDWWAAHYTDQEHLEPGSVATQYADPGPVDLSCVIDTWYPKEVDMTDDQIGAVVRSWYATFHPSHSATSAGGGPSDADVAQWITNYKKGAQTALENFLNDVGWHGPAAGGTVPPVGTVTLSAPGLAAK